MVVRIEPTILPIHFFSRFHLVEIQLATVVVFTVSTLLVWVFGFSFWILLEAAAKGFGWVRGHSLLAPLFAALTQQGGILGTVDGWPIDVAVFFALLATWCSLYLAFDHLALWGNQRAQHLLLPLLPTDTGTDCFFVEFRTRDKSLGIKADLGYLYFTSSGLCFIGDQQTFTLPRNLFSGSVTLHPSFGNLAATYIEVSLVDNYGTIQLLGRDTATRLSDTYRDAKHLEIALNNWLALTNAQGMS